MKKIARIWVVLIVFAIFSGCAINREIKSVSQDGSETTRMMRRDPIILLGVMETEAIKNGKVTISLGVFPERLVGEYFPLRIGWDNIAIDKNGREYTSQSAFAGMRAEKKGKGYVFYPLQIVITDGLPEDTKDLVIVTVSTDGEYIYNLAGGETKIDKQKFDNDLAYRKEIVLRHGSRLGDAVQWPEYLEYVKNWNKFETPYGILLAPVTEEMAKRVSEINPKYTFFQRLVAEGNLVVGDPVFMAANAAISVFRAASIRSEGWDYSSVISRRNAGLLFECLNELRNRATEKYNNGDAVVIEAKK